MPRWGILFCGLFLGIWTYKFAWGIGDKDSRVEPENDMLAIPAHFRGRCGGVPHRGGSGKGNKAEQMTEAALCKKLYFVLAQTLKLLVCKCVQGDGSSSW